MNARARNGAAVNHTSTRRRAGDRRDGGGCRRGPRGYTAAMRPRARKTSPLWSPGSPRKRRGEDGRLGPFPDEEAGKFPRKRIEGAGDAIGREVRRRGRRATWTSRAMDVEPWTSSNGRRGRGRGRPSTRRRAILLVGGGEDPDLPARDAGRARPSPTRIRRRVDNVNDVFATDPTTPSTSDPRVSPPPSTRSWNGSDPAAASDSSRIRNGVVPTTVRTRRPAFDDGRRHGSGAALQGAARHDHLKVQPDFVANGGDDAAEATFDPSRTSHVGQYALRELTHRSIARRAGGALLGGGLWSCGEPDDARAGRGRVHPTGVLHAGVDVDWTVTTWRRARGARDPLRARVPAGTRAASR